MLTLLRNRTYGAVVFGHFGIDILNSTGPVLLAVLAVPLALSYTEIGVALTLYTFAASLSQPVFGWMADRVRRRPVALAGVGVLWTGTWFAVLAFAPNWTLLVTAFLLAALGSGLFHPIGTAAAAASHPERAATSTAVFFFCGQVGLALGPVLGGLLYRDNGSLGVLPLTVVAMLGGLAILVSPSIDPRVRSAAHAAGGVVRAGFWAVTAFVALVAVRSSIQATYQAFLPALFAERGWDSAAYGLLAGAFMLAAAIGNVFTGELADRRGMRMATVLPLLLSVPAGLVCLWAPTPLTAFVASALAGLLIGGQHSILVVHAQHLLPTGQGLAAGLILGFTFASGGVGTWLAGVAADQIGLAATLQIVTLLGLPAALLALTLPGASRATSGAIPV